MDTVFATEVAEWHDFYAAIAGAAATLVGLLFVSLALNPNVMRDDGPRGMRLWAAQTFHNFLVVLAIALVTLIPDADPLTLGIVLAILAGQGLVRVASDTRQAARDADPTWPAGGPWRALPHRPRPTCSACGRRCWRFGRTRRRWGG